jgi:hypothetical protein
MVRDILSTQRVLPCCSRYPLTLFGTTVQLANATGLASFNDLHIDQIVSKQLRAIAPDQMPLGSATYQITTGTASSMDVASNPVSNVSLIFSSPSTAPKGTLTGSTTVQADAIGNAAAPLNRQQRAWQLRGHGRSGRRQPPVFPLTILPAQSGSVRVSPSELDLISEINQAAPGAQSVQISSTGAALSWMAVSSANWLTVSPESGTTPSQSR